MILNFTKELIAINKVLVDGSLISSSINFAGIHWYIFNILKNIDIDERKFITLLNPYDVKPLNFEGTYDTCILNINKRLGRTKWALFGGLKINRFEYNVYWSPQFVVPRHINSNKKVVVTVHDLIPFKHLEDFLTSFDKKIINKFYLANIKYSVSRADVVASVSYSVANEIADFFKLKKVEVVTPAYDKELFRPVINSKELFWNKYKFDEKFILIGNMKAPRKNFEFVVEAFKKVNVKGILCDFGTLTNQQLEFAQRELGNKFKYLGYVDEKDLPMIYSAANAFVAASKDEGFDTPPLEAKACGTTVIASDIPVHREVLENEAEYFKINDSDKLSRLMSDALSSDKVVVPSKIIEKYDWKQSARKMVEIFGVDNV